MRSTALVATVGVVGLSFWCVSKELSKKAVLVDSSESRDLKLREKFRLRKGLTFYFFPRSPCARRVWLTLLEKGIPFETVMVDLFQGEQRHPAYLAINPQGKVPAIRVHDVEGVPDCCLFESAAITEWLDEQFPETEPFYPLDPYERTEVKMWQYWELSLAEEFWPLSRQQVDGIIWRFSYSSERFQSVIKGWASDDPFYINKVTKIYEGKFLTQQDVKKRFVRIVKGFQMLENALKDGRQFLVGGRFTQADIAAYPRLIKAPQNGILATTSQRKMFPSAVSFFSRISRRKAFQRFRFRDWMIWEGGVFPRFMGWHGWILPWKLMVKIGNWRSGINFHRVTLDDVMTEARDIVKNSSLNAIPRSPSTATDDGVTLYCQRELPMSAGVQICAEELGVRCDMVNVNCHLLENYSTKYLALNPFGEVPVLVYKKRVVYGPSIIVEFLDMVMADGSSRPGVLPASALERACIRRWFGWVRTCFFYQLNVFYLNLVVGPRLRALYANADALNLALSENTDDAENKVDIIYAYEHMKTDAELKPYRDELRARCEYVDKSLSEGESGGAFLVGTKFSLADAFVLPIVVLCGHLGVATDDLQHLTSWREQMFAKKSVKGAMDGMIEGWRS